MRICTCVIILFLGIRLEGRNQDTLIFRSSFERKQFQLLKDNQTDLVGLLLSIDSDSIKLAESIKKLSNFYKQFDAKNFSKQPRPFAKSIFKEVHAYFFKQYKEIATFSQIFSTGTYNCVSASALYGIILKHYDIPFAIKELPTHVYLVAYPEVHNIMFESTNPNGLFVVTPKGQEEYVTRLVDLKFTTRDYVTKVGYKKAFEEFYYAKGNISIVEIAGIQYSNQALELIEKSDFKSALHAAIKASRLYPTKKHEVLKVGAIGSYLENSEYDDRQDLLYLAEFANTVTDNSLRKDVVKSMQKLIYNSLALHSNDSLLINSYTGIKIQDSTVRKEVDFYYHLILGDWYGTKGRLDAALREGILAYKINPKNAGAHELISNSIIRKHIGKPNDENDLKVLQEYKKSYPFLSGNNYFESLIVQAYCFLSYKSFFANDEIKGYQYLELLETELKKRKTEILVDSKFIALPFAEAGAYHFRKKDFIKAKELIQRGFQYAPDDYELKERLRIVEDEMNRKKDN